MLFATWLAYALAGAVLGIWLTQNAFSAGPLQASLPAISAGEPLIGILLGVIVFGDRIQTSPGLLAIQAGGVAALVAGVVMVASDPALSQLRGPASTLKPSPSGMPPVTPPRRHSPAIPARRAAPGRTPSTMTRPGSPATRARHS